MVLNRRSMLLVKLSQTGVPNLPFDSGWPSCFKSEKADQILIYLARKVGEVNEEG